MTGRRLVSARDVAELLDLNEQTVRKHTRQGHYPFAVNVGTQRAPQWRYDLRRLDRWLESRSASPPAA